VIDQTPLNERDVHLADEFKDLPLKLIVLDQPGQCTSRNAGIRQVRGNYILFLDDDVEIERDTIEKHWFVLSQFKAAVSTGIVYEPPAERLAEPDSKLRVSSIFPTDNAMIRQEILWKSGLFDLAYDHRSRADGDLGMRLHLSGALMIQNLSNEILHHHAPRGGLRTHNARVVTAAQSKRSIFKRNLPSTSEFYLASRYFSPVQVSRYKLIMAMASLRPGRGGVKGLMNSILGLLLLPVTIIKINSRHREARELLEQFPQIPVLEEGKLE
jgi:glycosyltransferase involved in cell wall biosynthesis